MPSRRPQGGEGGGADENVWRERVKTLVLVLRCVFALCQAIAMALTTFSGYISREMIGISIVVIKDSGVMAKMLLARSSIDL